MSDFAARAARDATSGIPIVGLFQDDPVAGGLVASFARPGSNLTGVTFVVNLGATRAIGLTIPSPVLGQATEVIR